MTQVEKLAEFVAGVSYEDLPETAVRALKIRVLDALGCAIGALGGEPVRLVREQIEEFGANPLTTLIGGGKTAPDRAALYNGALVRYLDYNDSFLAPDETCHPSDNLGAVLAAAEYAGVTGRELLVALAVAGSRRWRPCAIKASTTQPRAPTPPLRASPACSGSKPKERPTPWP